MKHKWLIDFGKHYKLSYLYFKSTNKPQFNFVNIKNSLQCKTGLFIRPYSNDCKAKDNQRQNHIPVMAKEVMKLMKPFPGKRIVDMTFGGGGHSESLLKSDDSINVLGLDRDPIAFELGLQLAEKYPGRFVPMLGRFSQLSQLLQLHNVTQVDGVLFDLGCSSMQFDMAHRGFSVRHNGPLDMRMDDARFPQQTTAADVIEHIDEHHLAKILKVYGEEKQAKKISRAIIEARYMFKNLNTTTELASLVASVLHSEIRLDKLGRQTHPATKTFQALRMFVNDEMNELHRGLQLAHEILNPGGCLITLTFHSLEDRIVKRCITGIDMDEPVSKSMSQKYRNAASWHNKVDFDKLTAKKWNMVNKHVIVPSAEEIQANPRSRSAKLRCALKI